MDTNSIIHIMDEFNDFGRKMNYEIDCQVSSNKDFYVYLTTHNEYEVEVAFHKYGDDNTRIDINVSKGIVSMTWAAYDTTINEVIDFNYIVATAGCLIDSFNRLDEDVYNPPKRVVEAEDRDWWE